MGGMDVAIGGGMGSVICIGGQPRIYQSPYPPRVYQPPYAQQTERQTEQRLREEGESATENPVVIGMEDGY